MDFLIEKVQENIRDFPEGKIVVHCSAGIGRTGTLIAIYNIIEAIEELVSRDSTENPPRVSVFGTVRRLREQRFQMVITEIQYQYLYEYVEHYLKLKGYT